MTLRPWATPIPIPPVPWRDVTVKDGWLTWHPPEETREIPEELFLRELLDLDVDDQDAVIDFVRWHGMIGARFHEVGTLPAEAQAIVARPPPLNTFWNHAVDVEWHLRTGRALTRHWLAELAGDPPAEAWSSEGFMPGYELDTDWARMEFFNHLNYGLRHYQLMVVPDDAGQGPVGDLFGGLCLQLANHIAEQAIARVCGHCGRPFVRQLGGAGYGQYRMEGVIYCTPKCARARAAREYRRRKKEGST